MTVAVDHLYLSPHLDDIPLSCGGRAWLQAQAGESVHIVVIMAGDPPPAAELSPFAQELHARWGAAWLTGDDPMALRRREDAAANQRLGASFTHLEWQDAVYRTHPTSGEPLYVWDSGIFGPVDPSEIDLVVPRLAAELASFPARRVYAPLGIGGHVDHQLVRLAAERAFGAQLAYYEDAPYAFRPGAVEGVIDDTGAWRAETLSLSAAAVTAKIDAIACHASQISSLFPDEDAMRRAVRDYAARVGGERIWRRREAR